MGLRGVIPAREKDIQEETSDVIPFEKDSVRKFLDNAIKKWREIRDSEETSVTGIKQATCYVDAFQSVRISLFGTLLPEKEEV